MEIGGVNFLKQTFGVCKLLFTFTGKSSKDINANGGIGKGFHAFLDDLTEGFPIITTVHATEDVVIPALKRDMEMRHKVITGFHCSEQAVTDFLRFYGTQPETDMGICFADCKHQG